MGIETAFQVSAKVEELRSQGKDIITFHIGQPDFETPKNICEAAKQAIDDGCHGYTTSNGIELLRIAIAKFFSKTRNIKVDPASIVVENGAKPFIHHAICAVTDLGDEVIYPLPSYPIYESLIKFNGAKPVALQMCEQRNFAFDISELEEKVNENTKLLILNSPNNPTGYVLTRDILEQISDIVKKYDNLWVYSDEPYSSLVYDGEFLSIASTEGMQKRTIIVDSCSKRYAMTGWRLGFASNPILAGYLTKWVTNINSNASIISQYAALEALKEKRVQEEAEKMAKKFKQRRDLIVDGLNSIPGFSCLAPGGSFYVWPNVEDACKMLGLANSEELRRRLFHEAGVSVLSDIHFVPENTEYEGEHLRLAFTISEEDITRGLDRIDSYIRTHRK